MLDHCNACPDRMHWCHARDAARPECLADPGSDFPFFHAFSVVKVSLPIVLLVSLLVIRSLLQAIWRLMLLWTGIQPTRARRQKREQLLDRLEILGTQLSFGASTQAERASVAATHPAAVAASHTTMWTRLDHRPVAACPACLWQKRSSFKSS